MLSIKKISLILIIVLSGVSKAYIVPDDSNSVSASSWPRQGCARVKDIESVEHSSHFVFKQHSLLDDPTECYAYGIAKDSSPRCVLYMLEHLCSFGNSPAWISKCHYAYYSESIDVNPTEKSQREPTIQEKNFIDPVFFLAKNLSEQSNACINESKANAALLSCTCANMYVHLDVTM